MTVFEQRGASEISTGRVGDQPRFERKVYKTENAALLASFINRVNNYGRTA